MKVNEEFDSTDKLIIDQLDKFLIDVEEKQFLGDRLWTSKIKERLCQLGKDLKFKIAVGGFRDLYESEWLYDITWYQEDEENRLIRIPLIVESEWDKSYLGIKYDFEKLLVGNAQKRLLICQCKPSETENLLAKLVKAIEVFEENYNDTFLFAILDSESESEFTYKRYTKIKNSIS